MSFSASRPLLIAAAAAFFASGQAAGQCSATYKGIYYDRWPNEQTVVCGSTGSSLERLSLSGTQYAFQVSGCGFNVYNVNGTTVGTGSAYNPFGSSSANLHLEYRTRHVALLDDFRYGIESLGTEGWVLFQIQGTGGTISGISRVTRFYFGYGEAPDKYGMVYGTLLFRANNRVYAVGRYLDGGGVEYYDGSNATPGLGIYDMGSGSTVPPMTQVSLLAGASPTPQVFDVVYGPNGPVLYVYQDTGARLYDVSNPASPSYLGLETDEGLILPTVVTYGRPRGTAVADLGSSKRLYTYKAGYFYIYDVDDPSDPQRLVKHPVTGGTTELAGLSSDGQLLAAMTAKVDGTPMIRYYSVAGDTVQEVTHAINWSSATDPAFASGLEDAEDVLIVPPTSALPTSYKVLRSYFMRSFWDTVTTGCVSSAPNAGVTVTRLSSTGTPGCTPTHSTATLGFPGDQFRITNSSTGEGATVTSLTVTGPGYASGDIKGSLSGGQLTWPAGTAYQAGEYVVTLEVNNGESTATQYIHLCGNPTAALAVTHVNGGACTTCTWLKGDTLRLSALGSQGTPDWTSTAAWTVEYQPTGGGYGVISDFTNNLNGTVDLPLALTGSYRVTVNPDYAFAESPDSTATVTMPSGAIIVAIEVKQGGTVIPSGGTALRSAVTTITGSVQCADDESCSFTWGGAAASVCPTPSGDPPFVCTVASNGFTAGSKTVSIGGTATPSGQTANASTSFTVTDCASPGQPVNTAPADGATVTAGTITLDWNAPATGTGPFTYYAKTLLGVTLCGPVTGTQCTYSASNGQTWLVEVSNLCGTTWSDATSFSVGSACTSPGTPSLVSPANNASATAGSVTFSWSSVSGTTPITYTVKNAAGSTLCSSTGTSCTASLSAQTLVWSVTASNSCGSPKTSATRTLNVTGSTCTAPGTPILTGPADGATRPAGNVTFSWTSGGGTAPITFIVRNYSNLGNEVCRSVGGSSCTANVASSLEWGVEANNSCGTSYSANRTLTIGQSCTAPGAPTLTAPANGSAVTTATPTLTWNAPTTGTTPFTYDVYLDGAVVPTCQNLTARSCTLPTQPLNTTPRPWYVAAKNSCPASATSLTWTFTTCAATAVPVADFTWTPTGTLAMANGYQQAQPYAGQPVTLTNTSSNGPFSDVSWYDFSVAGGVGTIKTLNTSYTWTSSGNKNVRLNVTNCVGTSQETMKPVPIAADSRPVIADFSASPYPMTVGTPITFTARTGQLYGDPDTFTWKFADETATRSGATITRTFTCAKQVSLSLTSRSAARNKNSTAVVYTDMVTGTPQCCTATAVPSATFDWQEKGNLDVGGVQQPQPYVGQLVHFTDPTPNTATAWSWRIALQPGEGSPMTTATEHLPTHVFMAAGPHKVQMTPSNCFGSGTPVEKTVTVYDDVRPVVADFTWTPGGAAAGTTVTFTAKDGFAYGDPDTFEWTFPNNVKKTGQTVTHAFSCGGANQVTLLTRRAGVASQPAAKTVVTTGEPSCCKPPNRAASPVPTSGATIPGGTVTLEWGRPTQGTDPLVYDVYLGTTTGVLAKLPECSGLSARQCTTDVPDGTATWFWKVVARNECGDTTTYPDTPTEWRFKACSAPTAPDATAFTWDKTGTIEVGGVEQQQPYVGQRVTFSYSPTVPATSWSWTDYQVLPAAVFTVPSPEIVYGSAGKKKLYLRTSNCAGTRQITQYIDVYADIRPVEARFAVSPETPQGLEPVTFTFDTSDEVGSPNSFSIDFGDGTEPLVTTQATAQHAYACAKLYRVTVTAKRTKPGSTVSSQPSSQDLTVAGYPCSPSELVLVDMVRERQRSSGVVEHGDLLVFNPSDSEMLLEMAVRDQTSGQVTTGLALPPLPPQGTIALADILGLTQLDFSAATLWLRRAEQGADELPVVNAWKYLEPSAGVRYGQFLPVFPVWPAADHTTSRWITGLIHNSLNAERGRWGYVTKLTFVDPTLKDPGHVPWGSKKLILRLYDNQTGQLLRTDSLNLDNYGGYRHDYLNRIFHLPDGQDFKSVTVQVEVPAGVSVIVTSAMYDNATENAVMFLSQSE